ncbi:hypothetical protein AAON49_06155 [Pseudotenacibaculum sp. MALMAid0570]|uniref:hypothetical protein n=1 Tax=Pseudotenacibaculum sp. MALMAid0570 TaxID=3143938 RepID=UPI0032DED683
MKSIVKLMYVSAFFALFLTVGCKKEDNNKHENHENHEKKGKYCYKYQGRPDIALTYNELVSMLNQYDQTKKGALQAAHGKEDTRVNFFKIEDLKAYLAYVEKLSKEKKIKLTGINIISAAYPDNHHDSIKRNYQTLILMPTTEIDGRENVSFDPLNSEKGTPKTLAEMLMQYGYMWSYDGQMKMGNSNEMRMGKQSGGGEGLSSGANRAGISPPL